MAKIIFTGIPGYGHVYPTLPVVAELRQRGHEIVYYNTADFRELIRIPGKALREAVERLLSDDSYRNAATRLGASFRESGGAPLAADVIESLVTKERENRN